MLRKTMLNLAVVVIALFVVYRVIPSAVGMLLATRYGAIILLVMIIIACIPKSRR